jgi:hypothetical protein
MKIKLATFIAGLVLSVSNLLAATDIPKEQLEFFEKKIRPVLKENCYKCHSIEQGKQRGNLALDSRDGVLKGGENGKVVEPGNPDKSSLVAAILGKDKDLLMPPKDSNKVLTQEQINDLIEWVKMGLPDPRDEAVKKLTGLSDEARAHWAYQPIKKSPVPVVKNNNWILTPVDHFILDKIEKKGMVPSPLADKETLLRRATYDLTGLPPTLAEIEAFLADNSPYAFAKVVDRLMSSPHYGERWGRYWLDTARYSDTSGDRANNRNDDYRYPYAWTYRDYVIRSFNNDKPYNTFILEQLAADLMPDLKDPRDIAALGFITVGQRSNNKNDIIDDRIDTVSKGFLAMTVSCARCHDHKFDPIPTKDYYALHGIFSSIDEPRDKPVIVVPSDKALAEDFAKRLNDLEQKNRDNYYSIAKEHNKTFRDKAKHYIELAAYGSRTSSTKDQVKANEIIAKENLAQTVVQDTRNSLTRNRNLFAPLKSFLDNKWNEYVASKKEGINPIVVAYFENVTPSSIEEISEIYDTIFKSVEKESDNFISCYAEAKSDSTVYPYEKGVIDLFSYPIEVKPSYVLTTENLELEINRMPLGLRNRGWQFAAINELKLTHKGVDARAMIVVDKPKAMDSFVFIRGQQEIKGDVVPRRFLEILSAGEPKPFKFGSGRLELAKAIADKKNPLTARVIVNRVWLHHFGEGFVSTPDDLGIMSETPSHPELLDYLASYLMEQNWSLKSLHKLIMLSKVYQISSRVVPEYENIDPSNRLLWRANVRRLTFESIRDSLLTFSGKLDITFGGQPINITDEPFSYRRSVYGYVDRGNLPELMSNFDFSNPQAPNSKRTSTIVPQQALYLMNGALTVDVARKIAARIEVQNSRDNLNKIFNVYRIIFQRTPKNYEIQGALEFIGKEQKLQSQVEVDSTPIIEKANKRIANQKKSNEADINRRQGYIHNKDNDFVVRKPLDPWETWIHALLMSNEVVYIN